MILCMSSLSASTKKDRIKSNQEKAETLFSPLHVYKVNRGFLLPWTPEFWSILPQNIKLPFSGPSNATHKTWIKIGHMASEIFQVQKCKIFVIQGQVTSKWVVWSGLKTHFSFYGCPDYQQLWWWFNQKMKEQAWRLYFPIVSLWNFF